jgi:hypothetical protein
MPTMRPLQPRLIRSQNNFSIILPKDLGLDPTIRVAIFDGGLPDNVNLAPWVNLIEPKGIGPAVPDYQEHGLAVTSAFLFGPLDSNKSVERPLCHVDHVRVLDQNTGKNGDFEYYDVLDRILDTLDNATEPYHFVNFSLGPDIPVDDDDISSWTASLDERFSGGSTLSTVAAGNSGNADHKSGLNRIQPPSDGVNVMAVGASDCMDLNTWRRVDYSCIGPGRSPGVVKPDGVVFGGSSQSPFFVIGPSTNPVAVGTRGTSFSAPYALRSAASIQAQLGAKFGSLAIRALLTHRADRGLNDLPDVGWGRFETDYSKLITCDDDEALVVYQGELPVGTHLRAPVPLPDGELKGKIMVSATLVIAPEVDPSFPNAYTRGGLEVAFRPNSLKRTPKQGGKISTHADTKSFFSAKNMFGLAEYALRDEGHKWEPCLKASQQYLSSTLNDPCFDIYYHNRSEGMKLKEPEPIKYALVVSIKAPQVANLYDRVVRTYSNVLIPLRPQARIQIKP